MCLALLRSETGDGPLAWVLVVALLFVFIAAVIIIGVWVARLISRVGGKR